MAQKTRSSSSRATRGRPGTKKSNSRNGSSSKSRSTSRNGARASRASTSRATAKRSTSSNGPVEKTTEKVAELASKAKPQATAVRKTGEKVAHAASKAKTPLVAGGAALAGIAGGVALKSRAESRRRPVKGLKTRTLPQSLKNIDLSKVDLDAITSAARKVRAIGEQVGDVADAADKTRKKHD